MKDIFISECMCSILIAIFCYSAQSMLNLSILELAMLFNGYLDSPRIFYVFIHTVCTDIFPYTHINILGGVEEEVFMVLGNGFNIF